MTRNQISTLQLVILMSMFGLGTAVLIMPSIVTSISRQDAWISILFMIAANIPFVLLYVAWTKRFPNRLGFEACVDICGKWIGMALQACILFSFVFLCSSVMRNIGDFMTISIMPNTPIHIIHFVFIIPVAYGAKLGLEVIARAGELLFPYVFVMFVLISVFAFKQFDLHNLRPVLANGWSQPLKGLYPIVGFPLAEFVIFLYILPLLRQSKHITPIFFLTLVGIQLTSAFLLFLTLGVLGVEMTSHSPFAVYELAKTIRIGDFLERIEIVFGMIWFTTTFMKLLIYFYATSVAAGHTFRMKDHKPMVVPLAFLVFPLAAFNFPDNIQEQWFIAVINTVMTMSIGLLLPFVLLLVAQIRGIKGSQ